MPADPPRWVLTTQADIDACADGLLVLGFDSMVHRGSRTYMEFYIAPNGAAVEAELGLVVIVVFGAPQVITVAQYEDSPFYEAT